MAQEALQCFAELFCERPVRPRQEMWAPCGGREDGDLQQDGGGPWNGDLQRARFRGRSSEDDAVFRGPRFSHMRTDDVSPFTSPLDARAALARLGRLEKELERALAEVAALRNELDEARAETAIFLPRFNAPSRLS